MQIEMRRGTREAINFFTRSSASRKMASMGIFMPNVWMASQGAIHRPDPLSRAVTAQQTLTPL